MRPITEGKWISQQRLGTAGQAFVGLLGPSPGRFRVFRSLDAGMRQILQFGIIRDQETCLHRSDLPSAACIFLGCFTWTSVSRLNPDWYLEHYFTYYSAIRALAPTPGHEGFRSNTLPLARGVLYPSVDPVSGIVKCFDCHSTGPPHIRVDREPGVRCEACHGPGSLHVETASLGQAAGPAGPFRTRIDIGSGCGKTDVTDG